MLHDRATSFIASTTSRLVSFLDFPPMYRVRNSSLSSLVFTKLHWIILSNNDDDRLLNRLIIIGCTDTILCIWDCFWVVKCNFTDSTVLRPYFDRLKYCLNSGPALMIWPHGIRLRCTLLHRIQWSSLPFSGCVRCWFVYLYRRRWQQQDILPFYHIRG